MTKESESRKPIVTITLPPKSSICTEILYFCLFDIRELLDLFLFTVFLANQADEVVKIASKALLPLAKTEEDKLRHKELIENKGVTAARLNRFAATNSRNLVTTTVDAILWYFVEIIRLVIQKKPDLLRSNESITFEEIMDTPNRLSLINYITDKKIGMLSYGGIKNIEKYIKDRFGIELFVEDEERHLLGIFLELRNIHVHNRGFVNRLFLSRVSKTSDFNFRIGKRYHVDFDEFTRLTNNSLKIISRLDELVGNKFKLKRQRYTTWSAKKK